MKAGRITMSKGTDQARTRFGLRMVKAGCAIKASLNDSQSLCMGEVLCS